MITLPAMSKAFTRESDDAPERPLVSHRASPLPTGPIKQPAPDGPPDQVRLGATVTLRDADGASVYQIVTPEQADPAHGKISWLSPLAQVVLNSREGDRISFREEAVEIV